MTTRFASGRGTLVGRGIALPVPIALEPAAYAGAYAYGEDGLVYYCDGTVWLHPDGRRPQRVVSSSYTAVLADVGHVINISVGGLTIPPNVFRAGDKFSVFNNSALTQDVLPGSGVTLYLGGTAQSGLQTLGPRGLVEIECFSQNVFVLSGGGAVIPNPDGITLVAPDFITAPLSIQRAQLSGVRSSALNASGNGLVFFDADVARFTNTGRRLLIEGQTTNIVQQPVAVASQTGAWGAFDGSGATHTFTPNFSVAPNGLTEAARARWQGAATNTPTLRIPLTGLVNGATYRVSGWIFSRSLSGLSSLVGLDIGDGTPTNILSQLVMGQWARFQTSVTAGQNVNAQWLDILFNWLSGDLDLDLWGVQVEIAPFTTSLVRPPSATPGASTRGQDFVSALLSSLGVSGNGASTVLWSGMVPAYVLTGFHTLVCLDDATVDNRFTMRLNGTSGQLEVMRALAGATATSNVGAVTAGTSFKAGVTLNGSGRAAASLNGGAIAAVTGGPGSGITRFRLGNIADSSTPLFGEVGRLRVLPYAVSDGELQSLVGGLP
jgi:hypothetical protein